jgi:predicted RNase H-like HicB family nuclease
MRGEFTAVYEKRGKWYIAYIEEIPGVNTQGRTLVEAKENLKDAINLIFEVNRELTRKNLLAEEIIREPIVVSSKR